MIPIRVSALAILPELKSDDLVMIARTGGVNYKATSTLYKALFLQNSSDYYVDQFIGDDEVNSGTRTSPFQSIANAIAVLSLLTPSAANRLTINVLDGGVHTGTHTLPSYINLIIDGGSFKGELDLGGDHFLRFDRLENSLDSIIQPGASGGTVYLEYNYAKVTGNFSVLQHQSNLHRFFIHARYTEFFDFSTIEANVLSISGSLAPPHSIIVVDHVHFSEGGTGPEHEGACVILAGVATPKFVYAKIGEISRDANVTDVTAIKNAGSGTVVAEFGIADVDVLVNASNVLGKTYFRETFPSNAPIIGTGTVVNRDAVNSTEVDFATWQIYASGAYAVPPVSTDGALIFSATHTPRTNKVKVTIGIHCTATTQNCLLMAAVFDGTTRVCWTEQQVFADNMDYLAKFAEYSVTRDVPITFDVRMGTNIPLTLGVNGLSTQSRQTISNITIEDV